MRAAPSSSNTSASSASSAARGWPLRAHLRTKPLWGSCSARNKVVTEFALRNTKGPIGVAEYQLVEALPKDLEANPPRVEQFERELGEVEKARA